MTAERTMMVHCCYGSDGARVFRRTRQGPRETYLLSLHWEEAAVAEGKIRLRYCPEGTVAWRRRWRLRPAVVVMVQSAAVPTLSTPLASLASPNINLRYDDRQMEDYVVGGEWRRGGGVLPRTTGLHTLSPLLSPPLVLALASSLMSLHQKERNYGLQGHVSPASVRCNYLLSLAPWPSR